MKLQLGDASNVFRGRYLWTEIANFYATGAPQQYLLPSEHRPLVKEMKEHLEEASSNILKQAGRRCAHFRWPSCSVMTESKKIRRKKQRHKRTNR